jgi:hypothetical protein
MGVIDYLSKEWNVIAQAPVTFIVGGLLIAAAVYGIARIQVGSEISALKERISLRDDRIADYEAKLQGATPDEAAARMAALEARVISLEPRGLTADQIETIVSELRTEPSAVEILRNAASAQSDRLHRQLVDAFRSAGWEVVANVTLDDADNPPSGLAVISTIKDTGRRETIGRAFSAANLEHDQQLSEHEYDMKRPIQLLLIDPGMQAP